MKNGRHFVCLPLPSNFFFHFLITIINIVIKINPNKRIILSCFALGVHIMPPFILKILLYPHVNIKESSS
jgi:hypothetical protein